MVPDIVEIKRLCASGQWLAKIENGKILLHDTVSGETVCIGQTDAEPVRHGEWVSGMQCSKCKQVDTTKPNYCPNCGAKMDGGKHAD